MEKESSGFIDKLWNIFSSMKTGLALLGLIAVVSGAGTLVPQEVQEPVKAQAVGELWKELGFTHIYSTFYFRLLLGLLCINLIVCSLQRFKGIYLRTFKPALPNGPENVPQKARREIAGQNAGLNQALQKTLRAKGYHIIFGTRDNGWNFAGIKRRWGNWGSLVTHLAFVTLVIGALIGSTLGFKGFMMAAVGSTTPIAHIQVQKGIIKDNYSVKINSFEPRFLPDGERDNWYTDLSILNSAGAEVARQTISTNHPFTYNGLTFYQSSWAVGVTLDFNGQKYPAPLSEGESTGFFQLPGTDFSLNLSAGQNLRQPAISYQLAKGAAQVQTGRIQAGQTVDMQGKCQVTVEGWDTGLQVKKDPSVPVIWLGSGLLLLGLLLSFYWRPLKISGVFETSGEDSGKLTLGITSGKAASEQADKELADIARKVSEA